MTTLTSPPSVPRKPTHLDRLREVTVTELLSADNPGDRRKFSDLLDLIALPKVDYTLWPREISLEVARHATRRAIAYAAILAALRQVWLEKATPAEVEKLVTTAERVRFDGRIVGDSAKGFTWEIN